MAIKIKSKQQVSLMQPNQEPQQVLIDGLVHLIEGQKKFAEEFGLNLARVFPKGYEELQSTNIRELLHQWCVSDIDGANYLQHLFEALIQHQLALVAALDGVALHIMQAITKPQSQMLSQLLKNLRKKTSAATTWIETLQQNQQLRYQQLIVPGFIDAYIKIREKL